MLSAVDSSDNLTAADELALHCIRSLVPHKCNWTPMNRTNRVGEKLPSESVCIILHSVKNSIAKLRTTFPVTRLVSHSHCPLTIISSSRWRRSKLAKYETLILGRCAENYAGRFPNSNESLDAIMDICCVGKNSCLPVLAKDKAGANKHCCPDSLGCFCLSFSLPCSSNLRSNG